MSTSPLERSPCRTTIADGLHLLGPGATRGGAAVRRDVGRAAGQ